MKLIKKILLATDFSKASEYVVADALEMAKIFQSEITLAYVMPKKIENKKAQQLLKEFALKQLAVVNSNIENEDVNTAEPMLLKGDFSDEIVSAAEKRHTSMIMIGGGEVLENNILRLGSNAKKIIKKSSKPVLVVKGNKPFNIKSILCPVDFSQESKRALKNAITMAHRFKANLKILTVFEVSQLNYIKNKININQEIKHIHSHYQKEFDAFLKKFNLVGIEVTKEIKQGVPDQEILKTLKEDNCDLLVIGTTGRSGISKILMGSVTEKVIRDAPCSFITLKKKNIIKLEIESKMQSLEDHYAVAQQLFEDGFYKDSINEFEACLDISFMHLPSLKGLTKVYNKLGDTKSENKYQKLTTEVLDKMYNEKIEIEARKHSIH